ncbi:MAG: hypothetical protein ABIT38_18820, partial [Gemmatimonadaceae bacterium]
MALAILRPSRVPGAPGTAAFMLDVGSNRFYQVSVGDDSVDRTAGFPRLGAPSFTSSIAGPLSESSLGRTTLEIPLDRFDRDHRSVQVTSFRTRNRDGPALSDIVRVGPIARMRDDLPPISFSLSEPMDPYSPYTDEDVTSVAAAWREPVRMPYRERPSMSGAMLFGSLIPTLAGLASKYLPKLGSLLSSVGGGAGGGPANAGGTATVAPATGVEGLLKPETLQLLMQFLQQLQGNATAPAGAKSLSMSSGTEYSRASIAPALLAALPALAPLLEKVLSPETIKAVLEHTDPSKIIGAVTDSMKEIGKL